MPPILSAKYFPGRLIVLFLLTFTCETILGQATDRPKRIETLQFTIDSGKGDSAVLHAYIDLLGYGNDTLTEHFDAWMKKFPTSAALPYAIGELYYNAESPRARSYLEKVVELEPKNAAVYQMLSLDAERWGDNELARKYKGKAAAAEPANAAYAFYYADSFEEVDTILWKQKMWELTRMFPHDERGAEGLYWLGERTMDKREKIKIWEKLRQLYPPTRFDWSESAMRTLFDVYLNEGMTDKAIALAASMGRKEGFPEKKTFGQTIAAVRRLSAEKKYTEAQDKIIHLQIPRYSGAVNAVALLKAEVRDAAGSTQMAYDSLVLIQAKTPDEDVGSALALYGKKLGKSLEQTEKDLRAVRDQLAKTAPPFQLGRYTSSDMLRLEDYKGKVVLVTFWFPGCGPCRREMPYLQHVVNKYDQKDLVYLGINVLPDQDDYVLPFMKSTKFSFIPLRGDVKWAQETYHVRGEPANFLIDKEGRIVYSKFMIDSNNEHMLEMMINSLTR